jgi:hypothetical protein
MLALAEMLSRKPVESIPFERKGNVVAARKARAALADVAAPV